MGTLPLGPPKQIRGKAGDIVICHQMLAHTVRAWLPQEETCTLDDLLTEIGGSKYLPPHSLRSVSLYYYFSVILFPFRVNLLCLSSLQLCVATSLPHKPPSFGGIPDI